MTNIKAASRIERIPLSGIRMVFEEVKHLRAQGRDIIDLCIGRPDFDTPKHIKEAAKEALDAGLVHYTSNYGLDELREVISEKISLDRQVQVDPSRVIVTIGASEAVFLTMMAILNPGDEVIIPNPSWPSYTTCAEMAGAVPISVPLREENGFIVDLHDIKKSISPRTRMLVLNSPGNPAGGVYDYQHLKAIAEVAQKHGLLVLSDEIYEYLVYEDAKHVSIASLPGMQDRTVVVNGFSKAYSMTGWRVGYVVAASEIISAMIRIHQNTVTCATAFAQAGAISALRGSQDCVESMRKEFDERRKMVVSRLKSMPYLSCKTPLGAFYAFPSVKNLGLTSLEASRYFLQACGVAVVPGSAFGCHGEGYIRISYANSYENLERAMDYMEKGIRNLKNT